MEYHLEHHMFPMIPSYNLKKLRKEIDNELPKPFTSLFDFYRKALYCRSKSQKIQKTKNKSKKKSRMYHFDYQNTIKMRE